MSSYPEFSDNSFSNNANPMPFNFRQMANNPPPSLNNFQHNPNLAFLSFPPPSVPGAFHVFQKGPGFPVSEAPITANIVNSSGMSAPGIVITPPGSVPVTPSLFASNNLMTPASFSVSSAISALTSVPPPTVWNNSSSLRNPMNASENGHQFRNSNSNLWDTATSPNNTRIPHKLTQSENNVKAWGSDSSKIPSRYGNFERPAVNPWINQSSNTNNYNGLRSSGNNNQTPPISPWSSTTSFPNTYSNTEIIKKSSSQFRKPNSIDDINPWAQPPNIDGSSTQFSTNNFSLPTNGNRRYGHQSHDNTNFQRNFDHKRGHFQNYKHNTWKDKRFEERKVFKNEPSHFSCDTCDRTFSTQGYYEEHMAEHTKCTYKNCQFEAHPKIVAIHKKMQHDTGYADEINKLKNSDEIEKWRAERRKRFPTAENILKRKAEQAEKEVRGEVVETKDFSKLQKRKAEQNDKGRNRPKRRRNRQTKKHPVEPSSTVEVTLTDDSSSDSDDDSHIKLRKFGGIFAVIDEEACKTTSDETSDLVHDASVDCQKDIDLDTSENHEAGSEDRIDENEKSVLEITLVEDNSEGSSNVNPINIGSDSDSPTEIAIIKSQSTINDKDSDDESPVEIPISKSPLVEISNSSKTEVIEDKLVSSHEADNDKKSKNTSRNRTHGGQTNKTNGPQSDNPTRKSTLLEKLLADDIRHERNVIMQCIRHVVKKKFFGIGSSA